MATVRRVAWPDPATPPTDPIPGTSPDLLWHPRIGPRILLGVAALILFAFPGSGSLLTHEGRWAEICRDMMRTGDYFHPHLFDEEYFDKPLPTYWIMIASARLFGGLNETTLRIPGILAGLLAIFCTWRIGERRFGPKAGLTAGWLMATCACFVYWSRIASADIYSLAAVTAGVAWWTERRDRPSFATSAGLFAIMAVGAQMKGLIAPVLTGLAILPDLFVDRRWRRHLHPSLALAVIPAMLIYMMPFLLSSATAGDHHYESSGLALVFKENVLRYFKPFDHQAPVYVYVEYLPLYALPWTFLLPWVIGRALTRWKQLTPESRWPLLASLLILVFLSVGSGRRNYYVLPILPFVMLAIADWLHEPDTAGRRRSVAAGLGVFSAAAMLLYFGIAAPLLSNYGDVRKLGEDVRRAAEAEAPWSEWRVVLYDTKPQMGYYLDPAERAHRLLTPEELDRALREHPRTVVVTYARNCPKIAARMAGSLELIEQSTLPWSLGQPKATPEAQVAFIPPR
jgi:4-amino-4-deoxy-L-arabinose transferase-like glycosyltransferase